MQTKTISSRFAPGDLVTLRAMKEVEATEGPPQVLSVVFGRADWGNSGMDVRYYCRVLAREATTFITAKDARQGFTAAPVLEGGLFLLEEIELVEYVPAVTNTKGDDEDA